MRKEDMEQNESSLKKRVRKDKAKARHKRRFRYSFLTIILLVCLAQMTIGGLLDYRLVGSENPDIDYNYTAEARFKILF